MPDLVAEPPLADLDLTVGEARLKGVEPGRLTWLAPWPGAEAALSAALEAAHGVPFPAPGGTASAGATARILWAGRAQALLVGPEPDPALAEYGAVLDTGEAWTALQLTGSAAPDVLARLVPLDLRPAAFPAGRTCRTLLGHMNVQITATAEGVEILAMRSMAGTAAHEIERAMRAVAARAALAG